jgi:transposase
VVEVAQDLGIAHSNLRRWRAQYGKNGELAFPGNGKQRLAPQEEEIRRLKKEFDDVKQERDILKKPWPSCVTKKHRRQVFEIPQEMRVDLSKSLYR